MKKIAVVIGRILLILVVVAVVLLAVSGVVGSRMNKAGDPGFSADLEGYEGAAYAAAGSGFAAVSEVSCRLYGAGGETLCTASRSYADAQIAGAGGCAAVWSEGGTELTILHGNGSVVDLSFSGGVTAVDLNDEGTAAVLAGENGYKGTVSVIPADGIAVYRVYVGSGYTIDAALSPDSRHISILSLASGGSRVSVYATDREEAAAEYLEEDRTCFDIEYIGTDRLMLVASDAVIFLKSDGTYLGEFTFGGEYLRDFACGDGFAALILGRYQTGSAERLVILDASGNLTGACDVTTETQGLSAAGKAVTVRCSDETAVYDTELNRLGSLRHTAGAQAAFMRSDGSALIISGGGAAIFEP